MGKLMLSLSKDAEKWLRGEAAKPPFNGRVGSLSMVVEEMIRKQPRIEMVSTQFSKDSVFAKAAMNARTGGLVIDEKPRRKKN